MANDDLGVENGDRAPGSVVASAGGGGEAVYTRHPRQSAGNSSVEEEEVH